MRKPIHRRILRTTVLLMTVLLLLSASACSPAAGKPENVVDKFLQDLQMLRFTVAEDNLLNRSDLYLLSDEGQSQTGTKALVELACANLTYEISDMRSNDTHASVEIELSVPDVSGLLMDFMKESLLMALVEQGNIDLRDGMQTLLEEKVRDFEKTGGFSTRVSTVRVDLVKTDDVWLISDPGDLEVALIGGFEQIVDSGA